MNIWILESNSGVTLLYKSFIDFKINEYLVSGLLTALNQFTISEFKEPIESIDMGGFKWIYILETEFNLLFIAADSKDTNAEILRARLNVIKESFIKEYVKNKISWEKKWDGCVDIFEPFKKVIENYYSQWTTAESITTTAEFFDILGIFQQVLNLIRNVIKNRISGEKKGKIYESIEELFETFRNQQNIMKNNELNKIKFSKESGFNIININLTNCDISLVKKQIIYLIRSVIRIIRDEIGYELSLSYFGNENIFKYVFNNIALLKRFDLDIFLLQLFLKN